MARSVSTVLVYKDTGASEAGCTHLMGALRSCLDNKYNVQFVNAEAIISDPTVNKASLIAFGGGYTSGFERALGKQGLHNLRDYVFHGGAYLGLGAGGYFGCDYIEFDKGGPHEKFSERDLRFYPGIGIGPVYPGFKYLTNEGVHTAPVTFDIPGLHSDTFFAYIDGGGMFQPSDPVKPGSEVTDTQVLACFQECKGKPAAVVKTTVGKGTAILSGVHLEYDVLAVINSDPALEHFRKRFQESTAKQIPAFKAVLKLLHLEVK